MAEYVEALFQAVALQILGVLGIFFAFGFILSYLQKRTQILYRRAVGWKGILWTAWIGTPIHEIGHVFFALIFHHKIQKISLFAPNKETGGLGHVEHSYNPHSLYQKIGNFFIGAAPMIFGGIVIVTFLYFLVPNGKEIFAPLATESSTTLPLFTSVIETLKLLFSLDNIRTWNFWLFFYISVAVTAHMAPSKQDRRGMWHGCTWLVFLIIVVNALALGFNIDITNFVLSVTQYLGIFTAIFTYATVIAVLHFLIVATILHPLLKKRG